MSGEPEEDELDELRQERMEQLRDQAEEGQDQEAAEEAARERADAQKQAILRQNLTDGARKRLNTVKMSKPQVGEQIEQQVVSLAQSGRLGDKITEDQMKELLRELTPDSKSFDIKRR